MQIFKELEICIITLHKAGGDSSYTRGTQKRAMAVTRHQSRSRMKKAFNSITAASPRISEY